MNVERGYPVKSGFWIIPICLKNPDFSGKFPFFVSQFLENLQLSLEIFQNPEVCHRARICVEYELNRFWRYPQKVFPFFGAFSPNQNCPPNLKFCKIMNSPMWRDFRIFCDFFLRNWNRKSKKHRNPRKRYRILQKLRFATANITYTFFLAQIRVPILQKHTLFFFSLA